VKKTAKFSRSSKKTKTTHAGVLEFVAEEGRIYLPYWVSITSPRFQTRQSRGIYPYYVL
jgi:hypothetical protein